MDGSYNDDFERSMKKKHHPNTQGSDEKSTESRRHTAISSKEDVSQKLKNPEQSINRNNSQRSSVFDRISTCSASSTPSTTSHQNSRFVPMKSVK